MMRITFFAALAALYAGAASAEPEPVRVMVLGVYHMGNPGQDLHNVEADDVTAPKRQRELEEVAERLAAFAPTKIALESVAKREDFTSEAYEQFKPGDLLEKPNEIVQIGYRLAAKLGHDDVYLIDEQSDEIDYFPFSEVRAFAEAKGRADELEAMMADVGEEVAAFSASQKIKTIRELLIEMNRGFYTQGGHETLYYGLLDFADSESQPGAELNAYWYMRNAKIFAKLTRIAAPGDRVVVVFGSGHNYWLRHFVETTPGYELVDPLDYLGAD